MRAKSKYEKRVYRYRDALGPITEEHKNYCKSKMDCFVTFKYKKHVCTECNHKWDDNISQTRILEGITCPNCDRKLLIAEFDGHGEQEKVICVLTSKMGIQVVRMIVVSKRLWSKHEPKYSMHEISQTWIDDSGKRLVLRKNTGMYGMGWSWSSDLEIRSTPYGHSDNYDRSSGIVPHHYYPKKKITPILKQRGFHVRKHEIAPVLLAESLIVDNYAETLIKVKQLELLDDYIYNKLHVQEYLPQFRIALRHSYHVKDAKSWRDHITMLEELGMDIRNPKNILPKNFQKEHKRILVLIREKENRELEVKRVEKEKKDALDKKYFNKRRKLFEGFVIKRGIVEIVPLLAPRQVQRESNALDHCAYDRKYHMKKNYMLFSARVHGKVTETVSFDLKKMRVDQSRGYDNERSKYNKKIKELVERNSNKIIKQLSA